MAFCFLLIASQAFADPLTKEELFRVYVERVGDGVIAQRMMELYDALPPGAIKNTAKATLKQDLLDALGALRAQQESEVTPLQNLETNVGETNL